MNTCTKYLSFFLLLNTYNYLNSQVFINEFLSSNNSVITDPQYNEYADWIELYNSGNTSINLTNWTITDNPGSSSTWKFPNNTNIQAKGFLLIWADGKNSGLHTDFKLSADGEEIALYDPTGKEIDNIIYGPQQGDISFGRKTDGSPELGLFQIPTPGKSNNNSRFYNNKTEQVPVFSSTGGFYKAPIKVEIKNLYKKGILRYTIDGSDPIETSNEYKTALDINITTVLKARMFYTNDIPGPVITHTYFINEKFEERKLPVISLSTHPDYFYAKDSGLYVQTFKPTWEYPIHVEFYQADGLLGFHHDAGVQIGGLNAWILPQKLLNIYGRKKYGSKSFDFQLFNKNKRKKYADFILRCSGNDWSNTFFRDGMMQSLIKDYSDLDGQDFRPSIVFINGNYLGLHNIREKQDEDYCQHYYGIDPDSLDYIENNTEIKNGSITLYNQMVKQLTNGVQSDAAFNSLDSMMDTRNYTDYIISQIFSANTSWGHNISCFRSQSKGSRWRWLLHDYDRGFDLNNVSNVTMNWATTTNGSSGSNPDWANMFLRKMLENNAFKERFITRFADHLYVSYHPQTIKNKVDYHANLIINEMPNQIKRWQGTSSSYGDAIPSFNYWLNEVEELRQYGILRNAFMWTDLNSFFKLNGTSNLRLEVSDKMHGYINLHEFKIPSLPWSGIYFKNRNFTLNAVEKPGFKFDHWEKVNYIPHSLIEKRSLWKYRASATSGGNGWNRTTIDDSNWSSGLAELGYGDGDEATVISFGADANNKFPTYYFRKLFDIANLSLIGYATVKVKIDDGAVIYLNNKEIARFNMPTSPIPIGYDTLAISSISGADENTYQVFNIPLENLLEGKNLLAIEIHQVNRTSSDISFDAELIVGEEGTATILSNSKTITTQIDSFDTTIRAVFKSDGHCGFIEDTIFAINNLTKACSPYIATGDVFVPANTTLTIDEGVELRFPPGANLIVHGNIFANGTDSSRIYINGLDSNSTWGGIFINNGTSVSKLKYVTINNATAGIDRTYFPAAISCYNSNILINGLDITDVRDNPIFTRLSTVSLYNSKLESSVTGDCINVKQGYADIQNCEFTGGFQADMDAIDYDGVKGGIIENNIIHDFRGDNNDGMDIGEQCEDLIIKNNFIYHCYDKGISVGQESSAEIINNTIAYTAIGIALKDQSQVKIDHCTLFGNQQGISAYEKNSGYLGGIGNITNCIVSNASIDAYVADSFSGIQFKDCLSDLDSMGASQGDIIANPLFENPTQYDFHLKSNSLAIGAASDGKDLGTITIPKYQGNPQIMISEILYDDSLSTHSEFLELYNPGQNTIDISAYKLGNAVEFEFPTSTFIKPKEAIVVCIDQSKFINPAYQLFEWTDGRLRNEGEEIDLFDNDGLLIDFVRYNNKSPWPKASNILGKSIEITSSDLDNHFGTSWLASADIGGTPGKVDIVNINKNIFNTISFQPNPAKDYIILNFNTLVEPKEIKIYNELGIISNYSIQKNSQNQILVGIQNLTDGFYIIELTSKNGKKYSNKIIISK